VEKKRLFAFVRQLQKGAGANLKTVADIRSAEKHAKRKDNTSRMRQRGDANVEDNYFWSRCGDSLKDGGANYFDAFKAHKAHHGVNSERKGAALAAHALVGVSPEWLAETGSPHDLSNPRVQELIEKSKNWVESWMGEGAVWALRYDTDEIGSGIVDVIASPIRTAHHKSGSAKPSISVNKANSELVEIVNKRRKEIWVAEGNEASDYIPIRKSYRAMQDSWAWYAQEHLSRLLERGDPIEETRRAHLFPEEFKEALKAAAEFGEFDAKAEAMALELARMQANAEAATETAKTQRLEEEAKASTAKRLLEDTRQRTESLKRETASVEEALRSTRTVLDGMKAKRDELSKLEASVSQAKEQLQELREQADGILKRARLEAASLISEAKAKAHEIAQDVLLAWPEFERVPLPFRRARNQYSALLEIVKELFAKTDLRDLSAYRDQVRPEEHTEGGDPPPALDLVMDRAQKRTDNKHDLLNTPDLDGPQS